MNQRIEDILNQSDKIENQEEKLKFLTDNLSKDDLLEWANHIKNELKDIYIGYEKLSNSK